MTPVALQKPGRPRNHRSRPGFVSTERYALRSARTKGGSIFCCTSSPYMLQQYHLIFVQFFDCIMGLGFFQGPLARKSQMGRKTFPRSRFFGRILPGNTFETAVFMV